MAVLNCIYHIVSLISEDYSFTDSLYACSFSRFTTMYKLFLTRLMVELTNSLRYSLANHAMCLSLQQTDGNNH